MVKKLLCCVMLVIVLASGAWGEPYLWSCHYSMAGFSGGHSDYSQARFHRVFLEVDDDNHTATQAHVNATGTMTLSGGSYSYIDSDKACKPISGTSKTFGLKADMKTGENLVYYPRDDGFNIQFVQGANNGLNGVNVSWNFPDMSSLNGQGRIPAFRTTQEQLASFVPYVEYVYNGSNVTGLKWRVVKASDTATPVAQDFRMRFRVMNVYKKSYENFYSGSWTDIASGDIPEGTITFDAPIAASEIWGMRVRLYTHWEEDSPERYEWRFFTASTPKPEVWMNHVSRASLVNGKSDYSDAQFLGLFMDYYDGGTMAEAKHFTGDGRLNIPGGGYTLRADNESNDLLGTIEAGRDMSFRLKMTEGINSEYLYYQPIDSTGEYIGFGDGAETGLNGKTVTFTFPSELNMNISRIVPNFKSVSQQLAECVPYIELVTEGGNITSIDFCLVSARDTSTVVELPYRTELHFTVYHSSGNDNYGFTAYTDGWLNLDNPLPMSDLRYVRVRLYTYEDSSNPCVYQWNFYPSTASGGVSSSGGGGGGCNGLAGIAAIASLAYIISKRH